MKQVFLERIFSEREKEDKRAMGIEPTSAAWEAAILPLNYARKRSGIILQYPGISVNVSSQAVLACHSEVVFASSFFAKMRASRRVRIPPSACAS